MNKSKRIIVVALIVILIGAFAVVPLLKNSPITDGEEQELAKFTFDDNLAGTIGKVLPLNFIVKNKEIEKVDLYFEDSIINTWKNPTGNLVHEINTNFYGLGTYEVTLKSTFKNKDTYSDVRLLRILSDISPQQMKAKIVKSFPHNELHFTQGLEFNEGKLFEGTGDPNSNGSTKLMHINLDNGSVLKEIGLNGSYFGEGITILNNKVFQLTYKEQKCFVYDKNTLQVEKDFQYSGEGWGLCNNGKQLIMSNGTEYLTFRNPESFQIEKTIQVYDQVGPRVKINELEFIDGKIYANIWMLDLIIVIDPSNGKVLQEIDCSELSKMGKGKGDVLNGIAYNSLNNKLYATGKYWPQLFEISFE